MQARSVLEGAVVALAAARVTRQGLDRVRACLEAMRHEIRRGNAPLEADRRFHVTIAELTGNSLLVRLVGELFDARHGAVTSRMSRRAENARSWQTAFEEHEAILHALELRDPQEASAAMRGHLKASRERWIDQSGSAHDSAT
jgi:DNA-binding FadR family transcriptional regulator